MFAAPTSFRYRTLGSVRSLPFCRMTIAVARPVTAKPAITLGTAGRSRKAVVWVRLTVSAALDSSTTLNSLHALNRVAPTYALTTGRVLERRITRGLGGVGCVEALTDAGTANLLVNVSTLLGGKFS